MADLTGKTLGRYRLMEKLGEGGMAIVYKAFDTRLDTEVAVKVIRMEKLTEETRERTLKRFEREAKTLAKLTHPNVVKVMDYGEYEGKPYLVMEYLSGGTLKQKMGKLIPWGEAFRTLAPIARALEYAHQHDIIHRDVKASNILMTDSGQPMIADFGVAKILSDTNETMDLTGTGMGVGTPEYMAPEQWTGKTTSQSDQYALGVVLYEMITGRKPYIAETPAAILLKQAMEELPRPGREVTGLPEWVEKVLYKVLARDPKDRYENMGAFAVVLENTQGKKAGSSPRQPMSSANRTKTKKTEVHKPDQKGIEVKTQNPVYWILGFAVLVFGIILFSLLNNRPQNAEPTSENNQPQVIITSTNTQTVESSATLIPKSTSTLAITTTPYLDYLASQTALAVFSPTNTLRPIITPTQVVTASPVSLPIETPIVTTGVSDSSQKIYFVSADGKLSILDILVNEKQQLVDVVGYRPKTQYSSASLHATLFWLNDFEIAVFPNYFPGFVDVDKNYIQVINIQEDRVRNINRTDHYLWLNGSDISSDGRILLSYYPISNNPNDNASVSIATIDGQGALPKMPTSVGIDLARSNPDCLRWKPNSLMAAFTMWDTRSSRYSLGVLRIGPGEKPVILKKEVLGCVSWSPDGKYIVYGTKTSDLSNHEDYPTGIYYLDYLGGSVTKLTDTYGYDPVWSPDGNTIAFLTPNGISLIDFNTKKESQVYSGDVLALLWGK